MASAIQLTKNDRAVLGALLDPEAGLGSPSPAIQSCAHAPSHYDARTMRTIHQREKEILLSLNTASPSRSNIQDAIRAIDRLLQDFPKYGSAYNDRAQARHLMFSDLKSLAEQPQEARAVLEDLGLAISLEAPANPAQGVSPEAATVLSSAYTHRGYLLYKASQADRGGEGTFQSIPYLADCDNEKLLEMASRDFALGGRYGNEAAKQFAVHTNPYAKLCGNIVKEALQREFGSYPKGGVGV